MASEEEPPDPEEERGGPEDELSQDPFVERLRPDPSEPPTPIRVLEGLLGSSDREGYWRLYFTRELDYYAEFRAEDVVFSESIPPEQHPFVGQQATRVGIRRDATIEYTQVRTPRPVDEFDLDVRLMDLTRRPTLKPRTMPGEAESCGGTCGPTACAATCEGPTCFEPTCGGETCVRFTCVRFTCGRTLCGEAACR